MGNAKNQVADPPMIITDEDIKRAQPFTTAQYGFGQENDHASSIITSPVVVYQPAHNINALNLAPTRDKESPMFQEIENMKVQWLCINNITGSTSTWASTESAAPLVWLVQNVFTSNEYAKIFNTMIPLV